MPADETTVGRSDLQSTIVCALYGAGIIGFLVIYGLLQERIMTLPYAGEQFGTSLFLVMCNRIAAVIFSFLMAAFVKREGLKPQAALWKYGVVSVSNVLATTCQYEALKYVCFPVQMLGKSFKMMPVMMWGILISGKKYTFKDWAIASLVTGGVVMFLMTGSISSNNKAQTAFKGIYFLLAFLGCDGLTSTMQEKVFVECNTSKYNQMMYINSCSCLISFVTLLVTRSLAPSIMFCAHHARFIGDVVGLSASSVASQWCIYSQVKEFGALVFAATMNVRQVVSILFSYARYGHAISGLQILALIIVFGALLFKSFVNLADSYFAKKSKGEPHEKTPLDIEAKPAQKPTE